MNWSEIVALAAVLVSALALGVSVFSWKAMVQANRAAIYDHRFAVYSEVEKFIAAWTGAGKPDMSVLPNLVGAWRRSQFLFPADVTAEIRQVWVDAVQADYDQKVLSGQVEGDRGAAADRQHELLLMHTKGDSKIQTLFTKHLKVRV